MRTKIEPKIKNLVDILNRIPYISTHSSCQGHFRSIAKSPVNENAHIRFHVRLPYESEFTNLAQIILSSTINSHPDYIVEIFKRFYMVSNELPLLQYDWILEIKPHESIKKDREKRRVTDSAISTIEKTILQYLESKDFSVL